MNELARKVNQNPFDLTLRHKYYSSKKLGKKVLKHNIRTTKYNLIAQLNNKVERAPRKYWDLVNELEEIQTEKP